MRDHIGLRPRILPRTPRMSLRIQLIALESGFRSHWVNNTHGIGLYPTVFAFEV